MLRRKEKFQVKYNFKKIDTLIAKHVFDMNWEWCDTIDGPSAPVDSITSLFPPYSTDIAAAWEVLVELGNCANVIARGSMTIVDIFKDGVRYEAKADTVALAICLAALKVKGIEVSE